MGNVLNSIIANQSINMPEGQVNTPVLTYNSNGKVKPLEDKAKLLPSRIFGSPFEYAHDIKQDVLNIKKAAKGQANDHELGRINDLAMKLGSLGLAAYLFVKNPFKMNKVMEFVGFGSFFASMALWPKLAIQAPIKARTGVDIHQKYVDSQGRKKMVFQDPQYVLTDLYSQEELDKMGDKLKVSKNLPDRNNFIKQRAQKTALQGNTLWMMTAGAATPTMSALLCNRLEKPVRYIIEKADLANTKRSLDNLGFDFNGINKLKNNININKFKEYLNNNSERLLDDGMLEELSQKLGGKANSAMYKDAIKEELKLLKNKVVINPEFILNALKGQVPENIIESLTKEQTELLHNAMKEGSLNGVADIISTAASSSKRQKMQMQKMLLNSLNKAKIEAQQPKVIDFAEKILELFETSSDFSSKKSVLDKYISARVGDKSGSYIANQWDRVGNQFMRSLKLNTNDLNAISQGKTEAVADKITDFVSGNGQDFISKLLNKAGAKSETLRPLTEKIKNYRFNSSIKKLVKLINQYEEVTGDMFIGKIEQAAQDVFGATSEQLLGSDFVGLAEAVKSSAKKGTIENIVNVNTQERIAGAKSSFYRLLQTIDLFKRVQNGSVREQVINLLKENGNNADDVVVDKLIKTAKDIMLNSTTTDYVEKMKSAGFNLSKDEYKVVMQLLFGDNTGDTIRQALANNKTDPSKLNKIMSGFNNYKKEAMNKLANWKNNVTVDLSRYIVDGETNSANAIERNNLVGKPIKNLMQDFAKQKLNSNKWFKIFGTAFLILTAITITAGLFIGRKSKIEKQAEAESRTNG